MSTQVVSLPSLIAAAEAGTLPASDVLFDALYSELHRIAKRELAKHGAPLSLGATTLLHEAYLEMSGRDTAFPDRPRFMAYAARVMRGLIIDHARSRSAVKRGGQFEITSLGTFIEGTVANEEHLQHISDALDELARVDPSLAEIVDLRFFCGFSFGEIAAMRGASERTVQRQWEKARIYLHRTLRVNPAL